MIHYPASRSTRNIIPRGVNKKAVKTLLPGVYGTPARVNLPRVSDPASQFFLNLKFE